MKASRLMLFAALASSCAGASEIIWQGGDGAYWTNAVNWAGGKIPSATDIAVFNTDGSTTVKVAGSFKFPSLKFTSGTTTFAASTYRKFNATTGTVDVAKNAVFDCRVGFQDGNDSKRVFLRKTGAGTWYLRNKSFTDMSSGRQCGIIVEGGILIHQGDYDSQTYQLGVQEISVSSGATFRSTGYNRLIWSGSYNGKTYGDVRGFALHVDGKFQCTSSKALGLRALTGIGVVESDALEVTAVGDSRFDGVFANAAVTVSGVDSARLTVGNPKVFASVASVTAGSSLAFAPSAAAYEVDTLAISKNETLTLSGAVFHKSGFSKLCDSAIAAHPAGLSLGGSYLSSAALTVQNGADLTIAGADNKGVKTLAIDDATVRLAGSYYAEASATTDDKDVLKLDGGKLVINMTAQHPSVIASGEAVSFGVGAKGGTLTSDGVYNGFQYQDVCLYHPVESLADEGTDGGLTLEGCSTWFLYKPFLFNGPSRIHGTLALIRSAAELAATPTFFGAGDVELDSCSVGYHKEAFAKGGAAYTLELATAEGRKLIVNGSSTLLLQGQSGSEVRYSATTPQNVEMGELSFRPGSILFLSDLSKKLGAADGPSAKVLRNAPSVSATSGRVLAPVVQSTGKAVNLLSYDADKGFCALTGTVSSFDDAAGKVVVVGSNTDKTLAMNAAYSADGVTMGDWGDVLFSAGSTLAVGDGVNPAIVTLVGNGGLRANGANTGLDFGEAPGYLVIGASGATTANADLTVPIRTAKTMTFASCADHATLMRKLVVSAANAYSGDTYVHNLILNADHVRCFSTGKVHVTGGQFTGGNIAFVKSGTWENDFELSGWGMFVSQYGGNDRRGAFSFQAADVVVSGDVELKEDVRFSSTADSKGSLTGVVSGDKLRVISSLGTIVLANDNTYTGGTEVISSALTLKKGMSAGRGPVFLSNGVLCFENEEPVTFANDMTGVGSVKLQGAAPVVFRGCMTGLDAPLDLCGTRQTFTELPPFAKIVNSDTKKATIALAPNLGTVAWGDYTLEGKISLDIGEGTVLDLGGRTLDVYRLERGAIGKVVNGTVNEEKPIAGILLIVR